MPIMILQGLNTYCSSKSDLIPTAHMSGIFYTFLGEGQLASHLGKVKHEGFLVIIELFHYS